MLTLFLEALRHLLGFSSSLSGVNGRTGTARTPIEEQDQKLGTAEANSPKSETSESADPRSDAGTPKRESSEPARLLSAYLSIRTEETLALLAEALAKEMIRELRQAEQEASQTIAAGIEEVRESVASSQREFSRIGRELVRSGAALESIQAGVSAIAPTMERLEASLREHLARELAGAELAGSDEILATLDGLEVGLKEGRELLSALAEVQNRLKDTTVQRWWRAMGEATGVKRPLPDIHLADLESLVTGLEVTYRRLQDALARRGVTVIEAVGQPFDPYVHEAVAVEPCPEEQDGLVLREERRGYRTADRIIRLSQVVVGRAPTPSVDVVNRDRGELSEPGARRSAEMTGGAKVYERGPLRAGPGGPKLETGRSDREQAAEGTGPQKTGDTLGD